MIPYKNRFHGHGGLRYLYKNGQINRSRFATLKYTTNPHRSTSRLAVVVSKKTIKSAVKRNRLRRRIYEYLRLQLDRIKPNSDVVIIISSSELLTMSHVELHEQLNQLLDVSSLYK